MAGLCVFLFIIGLLMVCLEIFIPGGVIGTAGAASIFASFWLAYSVFGAEFGIYFILIGLLLVMAGVTASMVYFPKTRLSDRVFLKADQKGYSSNDEKLKSLEGAEGIAATRLRPSGIAKFDGKRYSVVADEYVEAGEKVRVAGVAGSRIKVRKTENTGVEK
jgi:membrane-bound serine protease (ClpP class)